MNDKQLITEAHALSPWERHKFLVLVGGTIVVSLFLVSVALSLYNSSGAAQLDLSRPGYQSVRQQAAKSDDFSSYAGTGPINDKALTQFRQLYMSQAEQSSALDSFGGDVMSNKSLSIDTP
jgi:hypothetical protein